MAVEICRETEFGSGSRGFRFALRADDGLDKRLYEDGCQLETARFREGSIGQRMFARLSANGHAEKLPEPTEQNSEPRGR